MFMAFHPQSKDLDNFYIENKDLWHFVRNGNVSHYNSAK